MVILALFLKPCEAARISVFFFRLRHTAGLLILFSFLIYCTSLNGSNCHDPVALSFGSMFFSRKRRGKNFRNMMMENE